MKQLTLPSPEPINLACYFCDGEWWGLSEIPVGWRDVVPVDPTDDLLTWENHCGWCPECLDAMEG